MKQTFVSNGKLLLTGEYLVLHGALALALPLRLGQSLTVEMRQGASLQWDAKIPDGHWFSATVDPDSFESLETDDPSKAEKLVSILRALHGLNPAAIVPGLVFETCLDFSPKWGLGSSSTLISNLARWAKVDPYELLGKTLGGSGYDIACATADTPIHYRLCHGHPLVHPVEFKPPFADRLFFVYQGNKQHSSNEVKAFNQHWEQVDLTYEMQTVSELSRVLPTVTYFEDFCTLLQVHENLLAHCLDREPVQSRFPDFDGTLKSLGAWGGDFILAASSLPENQLRAYFEHQGLTTVFNYNDIVQDSANKINNYGTPLDQRSL